MKIENFLKNKSFILENSRLNYGVKGLHSIALDHNNGAYTRLMVTTPDHELYKNHCGLLSEEWDTLSMAIHGGKHHVKLYPIFGNFWVTSFKKERKRINRVIAPEREFFQYVWKNPFEFPKENVRFVAKEKEVLTPVNTKLLNINDDILLKNNDLYTIYVEQGLKVYWMVEEIPVQSIYDRLVYSNADLSNWKDSAFYIKPTPQELNDILSPLFAI